MAIASPPHTPEQDLTKEMATTEQKVVSDNDDGSMSEQDQGPPPRVHLKTYLAIFSVCLVYVTQNFSLVGAGAQASLIGAALSSTSTSWPTATLAIFTVVFGPLVSQGADYWGRKWFLVVLSALGGAGSIIVSRSADMPTCIAGFCVMGLAFGAQGLVHAVAGEVLPRRWRSYGQAAAMLSTSVGLFLGLIVAGAVNRTNAQAAGGFRRFYYITAGLYFGSAALVAVAYNPPPTKQQREVASLSVGAKLARLDWVGYGLLATSLVLFCVALTYSLNPYAWSDAHVSATFAVSMVLALALAVHQWKFKKDGLFHHGLFQNRQFAICLFCVFAEGMSFFAAITYFAMQVSILYETDFLLVTTRFAVGFIATGVGALVTGLYCTYARKVRWAVFAAFVIFVAFFAGMAATTPYNGTVTWGLPVLMGWALGMTIVALVTAAQLCVPPQLITTASCLLLSVRSLGGTVGVAIYQAVYASAVSKLDANVGAAGVKAGLSTKEVSAFVVALTGEDTTALMAVPGVNVSIIDAGSAALANTYAQGFRNVWVSAVGFVALAAVLSVFLFDPSSEFTNRIDAPVEKEDELYSGHGVEDGSGR